MLLILRSPKTISDKLLVLTNYFFRRFPEQRGLRRAFPRGEQQKGHQRVSVSLACCEWS